MTDHHIAVLVVLGLSVLGVVADVFLKLASESSSPLGHYGFYVGVVGYAGTAFGWVYAMQFLKLSHVGAYYSIFTILLLVVVGVVAFEETLRPSEWLGIALAMISVVLLFRLN